MYIYIYIYIYINMIWDTLRYLWAPPKRNARQEQQPAARMEEQCLGRVSQSVFRQSVEWYAQHIFIICVFKHVFKTCWFGLKVTPW